MKAIATIIWSLWVFSTTVGQTIEKLDEKNGFKEFTLGDSFSKWENQVIYVSNFPDNSKLFQYSGNCCQYVFNYEVEKIGLRFKEDKLVAIFISTKKFQKGYTESGEYATWRMNDFESIKSSFTYLFGEPTSKYVPKGSDDFTLIWEGKKVVLISKYVYLGSNDGDRQIITVGDLAFLKKEIDEGF